MTFLKKQNDKKEWSKLLNNKILKSRLLELKDKLSLQNLLKMLSQTLYNARKVYEIEKGRKQLYLHQQTIQMHLNLLCL